MNRHLDNDINYKKGNCLGAHYLIGRSTNIIFIVVIGINIYVFVKGETDWKEQCLIYLFMFCLMQFRHLQRYSKSFLLLHDNVYIVYCIGEFEEAWWYTTNASSCVSFVVFIASHWLWWIVPLIARWTENILLVLVITWVGIWAETSMLRL